MGDCILPDAESHLYQIHLRSLEEVHSKVKQSGAVLFLLADWVSESNNMSFGHESRFNLMQISFLLTDLMREVEKLLPEV